MSDDQKLSAAYPNKITDPTVTGLQITTVNNSAFDVNNTLGAAQVYSQLNMAVNELIGMDVKWFRAVPQSRSQDVIFQEYTLSNVSDIPLCVKVVLPDGNFPDSKYNYDLMGLEYEVPLEIHLDKYYWEKMAGKGTAPQKNDIIYFVMPNKLYEVTSSYLLRGFMEQETTWKLNLRKYQPQASRKESDILKQTIDNYTVSEESLFGEKLESDYKKIANDKQMSPFNSTERDEYKVLDRSLEIIPSKIDIYGTTVAEAFYDLNTSRNFDAVTYKGSDSIKSSDDRCLISWNMIDPGVQDEHVVKSITPEDNLVYPANYVLKTGSRANLQIDQTIVITRPGSLNFYAKVINCTNQTDGFYQIQIDQTIINHLNSIKPSWPTAKNYKLTISNPASILDGFDHENKKGFKVDILANQYIKINYNNQEHISIIPSRLSDKEWYGVVVNIGNSWGQYNTYVYKQHPFDAKEKLEKVYYETLELNPEQSEVEFYKINKSPSFATNIRLYASTMEEEKMRNELLSYFVKDGDQLLVGDNVPALFTAPYSGQQR